MPYLIEIRTDIPNGLLQTLDLHPNTSIREDAYQPVGQTGYRRVVVNESVTIASGAISTAASGLTAWLASNISSAAGAKGTATLTVDTQANLADGETFTIDDGENSVTFEIKKTATYTVATGNVEIDITGAVSAADVSAICETEINASILNVTGVDGAGTVALTNDNQNQSTADQNATNSETLGGAGAITNFVGATDSDALTASEASTDADDIIGLVGAGAITQSTINGALTTGAINKEDVSAILALLTGATYTVPASTTIETAGAFVNAGASIDAPVQGRQIYDSVRLRISFNEGRLSKLVSADFTYDGTAGAALAVLNDDGTVYTG